MTGGGTRQPSDVFHNSFAPQIKPAPEYRLGTVFRRGRELHQAKHHEN